MVETKPKKELRNMSYMELVKKAREMGMKNVSGLTKRELLFELGGSPEGTAIYDMRLYYDDEDVRIAKEDRKQVPGRTIYNEADHDAIEKIKGQNPWAFNNYDLTDKRNKIKYIFKRPKVIGSYIGDVNKDKGMQTAVNIDYGEVTCFCGATLRMAVDEKVDTERAVCAECGRQVIYINPDAELSIPE
jgi:hypothetical protein